MLENTTTIKRIVSHKKGFRKKSSVKTSSLNPYSGVESVIIIVPSITCKTDPSQ